MKKNFAFLILLIIIFGLTLCSMKKIDVRYASFPMPKDNDFNDRNKYKDKKLILLTFDDGPIEDITEELLDSLKEREIHATFFISGNKAEEYSEIVNRIFIEGHTIGSHAYDHKILTRLSTDELLFEIEETNEILKSITGHTTRFLRPPYGIYNQDMLETIDMVFINWSIDTMDWSSHNKKRIKEKILKDAKEGSIILLHDVYRPSIEAAVEVIDELHEKGFEFVSLEEFEAIRKFSFNKKHVYTSLK